MSEITYIELAEEKARTSGELGEFSVNLDNPITLNEGDQLGLFKSFIDTTVDGGEKIRLENDIQLNLSFVLYARNWWGNENIVAGMEHDGVFLNGTPVVDNKDYMVVNTVNNVPGDTTDMTLITYSIPGDTDATEEFTGNYQYEDVNGDQQTVSIKMESFNPGPLGVVVFKSTKIKCKNNSFTDITPRQTLIKAKIFKNKKEPVRAVFTYDSTPPPSTDFHMTPFIQKVNVKVPKGSYDPSTLAEFITTELTRIDQVVFKGVPQGNVFLTSGPDIGMNNGKSSGTNNGAFKLSDTVCIDSETGEKVFIPIAGGRGSATDVGSQKGYLIGASQVALTFQDNSIFTWEFLHTPYYVGASGTTKQIGIEYVNLATSVADYGVVNKYGGIAFSDLSANILDDAGTVGEPFDFWGDIMKFDVAELCVKFESVPTFDFNDTDGNKVEGTSTKLTVPFKDTVNTTGGLVSIDETVDKTSDMPFTYTSFTGNLDIPTVISGTFGIRATQPYDVSSALEFPYFRLDIECSAMNKIVGEKTLFRNTFGLIGRYYESGTFNTGTSADALVYQHKGTPVMLSSFNVRILDNDGGTPDKLGNRNTIFLQVFKQEETTSS